MPFDLERVRADFPILDEKIFGNRLVYLDSGASAQKPTAVLDKMDWAHRHAYANVHRGLHTLANRATEAYEDGRKAVARFINAARPEEIVFTRSATEAINLVASSFAGPRVSEGDEIVLTVMEHRSNIVPMHIPRARKGAVLKGKYDLLASMQPYQVGGEMSDTVTMDAVTYNEPPHRFEAGTPPIVQAIGLGAALDYMEKIGRERIAAHEEDLKTYAHERLRSINSLRIFGDAPGKGAIVSFELQGIHAHDVSMVIDRQGVAVRAGTHCAQPLLKRFGVTSTCRASFGMYNTRAEVDALAEALEK